MNKKYFPLWCLSFIFTSNVEAQSFFNFFKKENQNQESSKQYSTLWNEVSKIKEYPEENQLAIVGKCEESLYHFVAEKKEECLKQKDKKTCHQELTEAVEQVMDKLTEAKKDFLVRSHKKELETLEKLKTEYITSLQSTLQGASK
ncbi:MAG: hypothetical protein ACOYL6_07205 [Bacteriovoracaceae bacterium]